MRYKRHIAALLAAVFMLGAVIPAIADDGKRRKVCEEKVRDHPWQDDRSSGRGKYTKTPIGFVIGPVTLKFNVTIPFTQRPAQAPLAPASNTTTQKNVNKGK